MLYCRVNQYHDIDPAIGSGCNAFVSVGTALPSGTAITIILGFQNSKYCTPDSYDRAKTLLSITIKECTGLVDDILSATSLLVAPPPIPQSEHNSDDEDEEEEEEDNEDSRINRYVQTLEWQISHGMTPANYAHNKFTLEFDDPRLESAFTAENNAKLLGRDAFGYFLSLCMSVFIAFAPLKIKGSASYGSWREQWRWCMFYLPSSLLFNKNMLPIYCRHREALVAYSYLTAAFWTMQNFAESLDEGNLARFTCMHGFVWLFLFMLNFQMRFRLLLPLAVACFVVDLAILPKVCSNFFPLANPTRCFAYQVVKFGGVALFAPLFFVWSSEKRSRENFLRRIRAQ